MAKTMKARPQQGRDEGDDATVGSVAVELLHHPFILARRLRLPCFGLVVFLVAD